MTARGSWCQCSSDCCSPLRSGHSGVRCLFRRPAQRPTRRPGSWATPKPRETMAEPTQSDQIHSQARDCRSLKEVARVLTGLCPLIRTARTTPPAGNSREGMGGEHRAGWEERRGGTPATDLEAATTSLFPLQTRKYKS